MMSMIAQGVAGWLLTYAVHSTVLLGMAWLVLRVRKADAATTELLWKVAVVGGIVTASLQTGLNLRPAGSIALVEAVAPAGMASLPLNPGSTPTMLTRDGDVSPATSGVAGTAVPAGQSTATARPSFTSLLTSAWLLLAITLVTWYAGRRLILVGRLGDRRVLVDGELPSLLEKLCGESGIVRKIRLTASQTISSPVALGRSEICLPAAALVELEPVQQRAMLAHELAHLVRRDPHWLVFTSLVERLFFFQPLNRLASRRVQESAEYLADDWAARRTGGVPLARCLVKVAEWIQASPLGVPVAGFAEERSQLSTRVTRLLETESVAPSASLRSASFASVGVLVLMVAFAPGVSGRAPQAEPVETELNFGSQDASTDRELALEAEGSKNSNTNDGVTTFNDDYTLVSDADVLDRLQLDLPGASFSAADTVIVRALMARLAQDEDAEVRAAAADALGRIENPMAIPALVTALSDPNEEVRHAAIDALSSFDGGVPAAPIRALLNSDDPDVRMHAVEILGEMRDASSVPAFTRLLNDPDPEVRSDAIRALESVGDRASIGAISRALEDEDPEVRSAALGALDDLEAKVDEAVVRRALGDLDSEVRYAAIRIVGNQRMASLASVVAEMINDENDEVREVAFDALGEIGADIPQAVLTKALADQSEEVRHTAVYIIGDRRMVTMVPSLVRLLDDPSGDVREMVAEALAEIRTEPAREALRGAMNHSDKNVRQIAVEFFGGEADS